MIKLLFTVCMTIGLALPSITEVHAMDLEYKVPSTWKKSAKPKNAMRKAEYVLPGDKGKDAELVVFHFPGGGGSTEENLKRWYGQFEKANGTKTTEPDEKKSMTVNGLKVTRVVLTGTYLKAKAPMMMQGPKERIKNQSLLGGIVETKRGSYFFKAVGPTETINKSKADFDKLLQSVKM